MSPQVSSPFSTGSGGPFFEAKVQASFLLHLLIGGQVPCLPSGSIQSVRLQAKQAGFDTDDIVVTVCTNSGAEHRLLAQVKHHAAITASDGDFKESLVNAWSDFNNPTAFVKGRDVLVLITGPQSDRTLQHVRPLLDWARTSTSGEEFVGKVTTAGFSSDQKRSYLHVFRDVLAKTSNTTITADILWQFLRHLHLLSYDFDVQGSKDEAAILTMLDMAQSQSPGLDAQAVWEGLIVQAQEWNKTAGTYTAQALPERLRSAVQPRRSTIQQETVLRLQEHCQFVLGAINTELAPGVRLLRTDALDVLVDAVESSRVVVVQGPPGSGKSAVVKMLLEALPDGIIPFAFKAQEFNYPHLHQFLTSIGISLPVAQIRSGFALYPRKLLLVDGAERLFEMRHHEAFRHLIQQLSGDDSWTVVITCRESSAQLLREHLLGQWGTDITTVAIPPFSTEELEWVSERLPQLAPLIANQRLSKLLRLPFILSLASKAFPASTSAEAVTDINEHQFKDIVWRDYVERAAQAQGGLPIRRGQCLISVSVERARGMSLFVSPKGLDSGALNALMDDGILIKSNTGSFAPAHDVLEDWAVSRFIAQEFEVRAAAPARFIEAIGTEPAMRRGFRLWLIEGLAASENRRVTDFVLSAFQHADVTPVWRDEIAIAVLQSENAGEFVRNSEQLLLDDNKVLYKQLVHILRTACKGPNEVLLRMYGLHAFRDHIVLGSVFVEPVGSGWREFVLFAHRNLATFDLKDTDTLVGLLKDWSQGLRASDPLPVEAPAVAQICLKYWALLTSPGMYSGRLEKEFLQLLFKIPHAAPNEVSSLIRSAMAKDLARDHHSETVLEYVTKSFECQPLCTHLPNLVIEVAEAVWRLHAKDRDDYRSHRDLEELFGFEDSVHFNFFPESALQGPFMFLLASHSGLAVDFIVRLANQAALSYSQSKISHEVCNVQLPTSTGFRPLIASPRLWALYRGITPGPDVLGCALMALESWLLEQAKQGIDIRTVFRRIFYASSSVATISILASVATAYPESIPDEVFSILSVKEFYLWDFDRSHREQVHVFDMRAMIGISTVGIEEIYYRERKASAALPHRKENLESLAFRLQLTSMRDKLHAILDQFHIALPPTEKQTEADKNWRIALHRMDVRHFKAQKGEIPGQVFLVPSEPAPDLQQYIDKATEDSEPVQRRMRLMAWGMSQLRREAQSLNAFPDWRDALREAQALREQLSATADEPPLGMSGPGFVAACLVRDHLAELTPVELNWCQQVVIEEVVLKDADRTYGARISKNTFDASRPCALVLPILLRSAKDRRIRNRIEKCLAVAVTHTSEEVRDYAAEGVRSWLWEIDPEFAKACVGSLFELAKIENQIRRTERRRKSYSRERGEKAVLKATEGIRARIVKRKTVIALKAPVVDLTTHDWPELLDALGMIKPNTAEPELVPFFIACLAEVLREAEAAEAWQSKRNATYEFQHPFARLFAQFALARSVGEAAKIGDILREHIELCPKYLGELLETLPYEEDKVHSDNIFWTIWRSVSNPIFEHSLLRTTTHIWRYDEMRKLLRILLFADIEWKKDINEWAPVSANRDFIESAASAVGNTRAGFGALMSLLSSVGQVFLPDAIRLLAGAVESAEDRNLLEDPGADFQLEILLRKICYNYGTDIRQRPELHRAVILLLDKLVERGSHTGFRLRDYIISPLPIVN